MTCVLLTISTLLVFFGTLDQANFGIQHTQQKYFESWIVISPVVSLTALVLFKTYPSELDWLALPLPGGLLLGTLLVVNLSCAHIRYYRAGWQRAGIVLTHSGLILLIISGFLGSILQQEWQMVLDEGGEPVSHLSAIRGKELAVINTSDPEADIHHVIPGERLETGAKIRLAESDLSVRILDFTQNAQMERRDWLLENTESYPGASTLENREVLLSPLPGNEPVPVDPALIRGLAAEQNIAAAAQKPTYRHNETNFATAVVEVSEGENVLGVWLVGTTLDLIEGMSTQKFSHAGTSYEMTLRFPREYLPFSLELEDFVHRRHPNTDIPAEFASEVLLKTPAVEENRQIRISMNRPLRHGGYTFYQASFANNDTTSIFQVVRNPSWLLPYASIIIVGLGLLLHFCLKLLRFGRTEARVPAPKSQPTPVGGSVEGAS